MSARTEAYEPIPNMKLIDQIRQLIRDNPAVWNQLSWGRKVIVSDFKLDCGTAFCFAGHACVISGDTPIWSSISGYVHYMHEVIKAGTENQKVDVEDRAKLLLGLYDDEASWLFDGDNDLSDIDFAICNIRLRFQSINDRKAL